MTTQTLTCTSLRSLAIEMARQHREAGVFLDEASLRRALDLLGTATEFERWAAVNAYATVVMAGVPRIFQRSGPDAQTLSDDEEAAYWYREEKAS